LLNIVVPFLYQKACKEVLQRPVEVFYTLDLIRSIERLSEDQLFFVICQLTMDGAPEQYHI